MRKISILGCGWLGLPLAKSLLAKGFSVNGSTTSAEKIPLLKNAGIRAFQIHLPNGDIAAFLDGSEILIINIPPGSNIQTLVPLIEKSTISKVLFVSSTSVFADDGSIVDESTKPAPQTANGRQLVECEALLQGNKNFLTTILRFGGLIGEGRHPVHFLAGKTGIENPEAPVNLIHQKDCIGIIGAIIEKDFWDQTIHGTAPGHPKREIYYTKKASRLGLLLPCFDHSKPSVGKIISGQKAEKVLGYEFQVEID